MKRAGQRVADFIWVALLLLPGPVAGQPAASRYQEAASFLRLGQPARAATLLRDVLRESPSDFRAHNLMGLALAASGEREPANAHFRSAFELNPRFYPALKNLALNELAMGRSEAGKAHMLEVLKLAPADPVAHLALAEMDFGGRRFRSALAHYDRSRDLALRDPQTSLNLARTCLELALRTKALAVLEQVPPEADAAVQLQTGLLLMQLEKYEQAARRFGLARKGYPYQAGFNLALAYLKTRDYAATIRTGEELISQGFQKAEVYNLIADAYEANGDAQKAYDTLRQAAQLTPNEEGTYLDLASICINRDRYEVALQIVDIGLEHLPRSERLRIHRGVIMAMTSQFEQAQAEFQMAIKLAPRASLPYAALASLLIRKGELPKAVELLRRRSASGPADFLIESLLGDALGRSRPDPGSRDETEAVRALQKSIQLNPRFAPSRSALGKLYVRRNELARAIKELEKAIELDPENTAASYDLAQIYRKKGDAARARELFARVKKVKADGLNRAIEQRLAYIAQETAKP